MADFYGSISGYRDYHDSRNNALSIVGSDDPEILASLLVASEWMDASYRAHLSGVKTGGRDQTLEQPRMNQVDIYDYAIDSLQIPREYINATYEIAFKHHMNNVILTEDYKPSKFESASVDGAVSVKYTKFNSVSEIQMKFSKVGQIMSTLVKDSLNFSSLSGSNTRT